MVKEVVHDPVLLARKSEPATKDDLQVAQDLLDTLAANKAACVFFLICKIMTNKLKFCLKNTKSIL